MPARGRRSECRLAKTAQLRLQVGGMPLAVDRVKLSSSVEHTTFALVLRYPPPDNTGDLQVRASVESGASRGSNGFTEAAAPAVVITPGH
jgi:hypothetical protein